MTDRIRAGTRGPDLTGYLERQVLHFTLSSNPDPGAAIALVARYLDEQAGGVPAPDAVVKCPECGAWVGHVDHLLRTHGDARVATWTRCGASGSLGPW